MSYLQRVVVRSPLIVEKFVALFIRNSYRNKVILYRKQITPSVGCSRWYSDKKSQTSVSTAKSQSEVSTDVKVTVKEAAKTVSYTGVILVGIGVTGVMLYAILSELFSSKSPNSVYSKAVERCCNDERVKNAIGEPIQAYGEESRRGRRRHTSHVVYEKDGVEYMRMIFYLKGLRERATVHLEMKEDDNGSYNYRYLFVQLDLSRRIIILEDNRAPQLSPALPSSDDFSFPSPLSS